MQLCKAGLGNTGDNPSPEPEPQPEPQMEPATESLPQVIQDFKAENTGDGGKRISGDVTPAT
jgi:hypothetical protein